MTIRLSKAAIKVLKRLDAPTRERIITGIEGLAETPPKGDIKLLQGQDVETYRLRVGAWRVLYSFVEDGRIHIEKIAPRGEAYKGV